MPTPLELGPISQRWLREAGITTLEELQAVGSVEAYRRVRNRYPDRVSLSLLYGLETLLLGIDWRALPFETKQALAKQVTEG